MTIQNQRNLTADLRDTAALIEQLSTEVEDSGQRPDERFEADICNALKSVRLAIGVWFEINRQPFQTTPAERDRPIMIGRRGYGVV